jgi:hypothetical protein
LGNLRGRDHLVNLDADRRIILNTVLKKQDVRVWTALNWVRVGSSGGFS